MTSCPDGHESTSADYCSVCGLAMAGAAEPAGPAEGKGEGRGAGADTQQCANCDEPYGVADVFCENCGLDFLTGSLPEPAPAVTSLASAAGSAPSASHTLTIACDRRFYKRMDADGVLTYPQPEPPPRTVPITGDRVLLGRERANRGVFPDVDLSLDPAASSRHALLQRRPDGTWTVTDLGSTNGTYVGDSTIPIEADTPMTITAGTPIHLGAWTRVELHGTADAEPGPA